MMTSRERTPGPSVRTGGAFTISLDFELHWGVRDKRSVGEYRRELLGARDAIPRILDLFAEHGIHATWATVGLLFFDTKSDLIDNLPTIRATYANRSYDAYTELKNIGENERSDPFHFAPSIIRKIAAYPGQEIGTHTFSHFYCLENGATELAFREDLEAAIGVARQNGIALRSLVFPRNQCNPDYFGVLSDLGIVAYRGNPKAWMYQGSDDSSTNSFARRLGRFADTYLPFTVPERTLSVMPRYPLVDVQASRFLRPASTAASVRDLLHLRRVKSELTYAARTGAVYHLWWHPHNFGLETDRKLKHLSHILRHYNELRERYDMDSLTMAEIAQTALARRGSVQNMGTGTATAV